MILLALLIFNKCLASQSPLRIYGGEDAKPGEYPFVVRLEKQRVFNFTSNNTIIAAHWHSCTGTALSSVWVITAAHCKTGPVLDKLKTIIRYGHVKHSPWVENSFSEIQETIKYPLYKPISTRESHDIQLIKTSPMKINTFMKISAVDYNTLYGHEAIIAGFGYTAKANAAGEIVTETTLDLKAPVQILNVMVSKCPSSGKWFPLQCVVSKCEMAANSCPGDSGGPILHPSGLIGVVSMGHLTGFCRKPEKKIRTASAAMFIPVGPYIEWIYRHIRAI